MPTIRTDDGVNLYYEEAGSGTPIVFVHEFAGDHRSWEPQLRHFARTHRCIAYNARGYPPSDVPEGAERYEQQRQRDDLVAVLDALQIRQAHVVGCSMGAFATLHFGMRHATRGAQTRALSLTLVGVGSGAHPAIYRAWQRECVERAATIHRDGMAQLTATYGHGATRVQYLNKDPRGFAEFAQQLAAHSAAGSAFTMEGYQARRPSLYDLTEPMAAIDVPMLIVCGDEDEPCLEASLLIKRVVPKAGLAIVPCTGHAVNLEEPLQFNRLLQDFVHQVSQGRWPTRDPRAKPESAWGPAGRPTAR
ncbi:MAG TPA: alpha/beta hydrolase [Burkholderiaceae bacterium]|nr:alpha/beta hydrolase [Burkholderiaceae bacterium]